MCLPVHTYTHSSRQQPPPSMVVAPLSSFFPAHHPHLLPGSSPDPLPILSRSSPGSSPDPLPVLSRSSPGPLPDHCYPTVSFVTLLFRLCHPTARSRSVTAPMHHLPRGPAAWGLTETALVPPRGLRFHGSPGLPDSDLCLISRAKAPRYTHVSDVTAPRAGDMRSRLA